jgi:hypothetical protein
VDNSGLIHRSDEIHCQSVRRGARRRYSCDPGRSPEPRPVVVRAPRRRASPNRSPAPPSRPTVANPTGTRRSPTVQPPGRVRNATHPGRVHDLWTTRPPGPPSDDDGVDNALHDCEPPWTHGRHPQSSTCRCLSTHNPVCDVITHRRSGGTPGCPHHQQGLLRLRNLHIKRIWQTKPGAARLWTRNPGPNTPTNRGWAAGHDTMPDKEEL